METGLAGKVALVAASSEGIGYAAARALAAEGARLALCSRRDEAVGAAAAQIRAETGAEVLAVTADLATPDGPGAVVAAALDRYGRVDVLVTNTGGPPAGTFESVEDRQWGEAFDNLFMSAERLIRAALPGMVERGWGRVVGVTSCACREPIAGLILSNSVRIGLQGLFKSLANEYGRSGVTFNTVLPGYTLTRRMEELFRNRAAQADSTVDAVVDQVVADVPMGRAGTPEEIAAAVLFLASEAASYITGVAIPVDGGRGRSPL
jgi:3-oxoacyl-[acyl-carrier protein] reductase